MSIRSWNSSSRFWLHFFGFGVPLTVLSEWCYRVCRRGAGFRDWGLTVQGVVFGVGVSDSRNPSQNHFRRGLRSKVLRSQGSRLSRDQPGSSWHCPSHPGRPADGGFEALGHSFQGFELRVCKGSGYTRVRGSRSRLEDA